MQTSGKILHHCALNLIVVKRMFSKNYHISINRYNLSISNTRIQGKTIKKTCTKKDMVHLPNLIENDENIVKNFEIESTDQIQISEFYFQNRISFEKHVTQFLIILSKILLPLNST